MNGKKGLIFTFEYLMKNEVPLDFGGEEHIGVLRIELEGLSYVRPSHGARWEWQFTSFGSEEFDE